MNTEWQLERHFYADRNDEAFDKDVEQFKTEVDAFVKDFKGQIASVDEDDCLVHDEFTLRDALDRLSAMGATEQKVMMYLSLYSSLESQDQGLQKIAQRLQKTQSQYQEKLTFLHEEYNLIGYERLMEMSGKQLFAPYRNYLVAQANSLKHLLPEDQEKLLIKVDAASEQNLHEELSSSFEFDFRGGKITHEEVASLRENPDRSKRYDAFRSIAEVYQREENQIVFGNLYSLVCKDGVFNKEVRGYKTVMSAMNFSEEVSDEAVDTLISTVQKAYPLYHEFLKKKKELLGIEDFSIHDVFAPLVSGEQKTCSFEEGWKLFLEAIKDVDPVLYGYSERMLEDARISVFPKKGKVSGAYANYMPFVPEFMLLNWTDTLGDVATLAHEMGHCFHGWLSKKQNPLVYGTPLTLAETASIFSETIMFDALMRTDMTEAERQRAIVQRLDDIFGTIFRQISYILFERRCHESFDKNEPLTYEDYNRMWAEEVVALYGPGVTADPSLMQFGWSWIPHIYHTPFYCYTYAFGNIISLNLVQQYKNADNKQEFITKYHEFLSAGGSERPEDLLFKVFGLKMDEGFYTMALDSVRDLMQMLRQPVTA